MSRSFDFTVATVLTIVAVIFHMIGIEIFAPGTPLYDIAATGTANMGGQSFASFTWQVIAIWVPMIVGAGVWVWAFVREYRRQVVTAAGRVR